MKIYISTLPVWIRAAICVRIWYLFCRLEWMWISLSVSLSVCICVQQIYVRISESNMFPSSDGFVNTLRNETRWRLAWHRVISWEVQIARFGLRCHLKSFDIYFISRHNSGVLILSENLFLTFEILKETDLNSKSKYYGFYHSFFFFIFTHRCSIKPNLSNFPASKYLSKSSAIQTENKKWSQNCPFRCRPKKKVKLIVIFIESMISSFFFVFFIHLFFSMSDESI